MPRLITLSEWSRQMFGDHKPHRCTLLRWVHDGRIRPQPKKVGRAYFVDPKAEYVDADSELIERML